MGFIQETITLHRFTDKYRFRKNFNAEKEGNILLLSHPSNKKSEVYDALTNLEIESSSGENIMLVNDEYRPNTIVVFRQYTVVYVARIDDCLFSYCKKMFTQLFIIHIQRDPISIIKDVKNQGTQTLFSCCKTNLKNTIGIRGAAFVCIGHGGQRPKALGRHNLCGFAIRRWITQLVSRNILNTFQ